MGLACLCLFACAPREADLGPDAAGDVWSGELGLREGAATNPTVKLTAPTGSSFTKKTDTPLSIAATVTRADGSCARSCACPALWTPAGLVPLGDLGGAVHALAANEAGVVTGVADDASGSRIPFLWEAGTAALLPIEAPPCTSTACEVVAIDAAGRVAATWMATDGHLRAMWSEAAPSASDADADGVPDAVDACPNTHIPEPVPLSGTLRPGRWALVDGDTTFDTAGAPPVTPFTTASTDGCSCRQIIHALKLGMVAARVGCPTADVQAFIDLVAP